MIVNFHWGQEFQSSPSAFQLGTAEALARDPDITAIVGQHVHVVQPITRVHGKLVVYGEGQLLSNESAACCPVQTEDGMLVFLHIVGAREALDAWPRITYMPTWDRHPDYTVLPIGVALAPPSGAGRPAAGLIRAHDGHGRKNTAGAAADPSANRLIQLRKKDDRL